jgi:hypothetical protein
MTAVRQTKAAAKKTRKPARNATERTRAAKKAAPTTRAGRVARTAGATSAASQVKQVRLQPDEVEALHEAMRQLHLASASEALREGIRLLTREAAEVTAAEDIRRFYGAEQAPLPDGVATPTDEELAAADAEQW